MCGALRVRRQGAGELGNVVHQWFLAFIPRWIWRSKPMIHRGGKFYAELHGMPFSEATSSTAISFMGDCILAGGIPGLIIGAGLLGLVLSWVGVRFVPPGPMSVGMVLFYHALVLRLVQVEMEIPSTGIGTCMGLAAATIIYVAVCVRPRQASALR